MFTFDQLGKEFAGCELSVMRAESLTAYNSPERKCVVERSDSTQALADTTKFEITAAPFSLIHAVLK